MFTTLALLVLAVLLMLYAARGLAPASWNGGLNGLRRAITAPVPEPTTVERAVPALTLPAGLARSRALAIAAPLAIVLIACVPRVINLTGVPFGFFCDEASPSLDAYFIAHTLHDQHGAFLPFFPQALSEYPGGFQTYWQIPFVTLFGLTEFAARFGSVIEGVLTVWLTYLFVSRASNRLLGLISAFLLGIVPWHIMESRVGWQVNNLPFITALMLLFLYLGLERPRWLPLAFICGALGIYGYFPGRIFFPLFCAAWIIIYAPPLLHRWRMAAIGVVAALIFLIPTVIAVANGVFFARYNQLGSTPLPFSRQLAAYWNNYIGDFSTSSLFATTDIISRHFVAGFGLLYPIEAPFLVLGALAMLWRHNRFDMLCLVWLVIYPLGSAVAGSPIFTRGIQGVIVLQITAAQGLYITILGLYLALTRLRVPRSYRAAVVPVMSTLIVLVGLGATGQFMNAYLNDYPRYSAGFYGWQWGAQQIVAYFEAHRRDYSAEFMDAEFNAPDELLAFYTTPNYGQCPACQITNVTDANTVTQSYIPTRRQLWAAGPSALAQSALQRIPHRIVGQLRYLDGSTAFYFLATGPGYGQTAQASGAAH